MLENCVTGVNYGAREPDHAALEVKYFKNDTTKEKYLQHTWLADRLAPHGRWTVRPQLDGMGI